MVRNHGQASCHRLICLASLCVALAAAGLLLTACAGKRLAHKEEKAVEELGETAESFNRFLEWQNYDAALGFVAAEYREAFMAGTERIAGLASIEQVQILYAELGPFTPDPDLDEEGNSKLRMSMEGRQGRVAVRYVNVTLMPSNKVFSARQMQYWERRGETWVHLPDLSWILGEEAWNECLSARPQAPAGPPAPQEEPFAPPPKPQPPEN